MSTTEKILEIMNSRQCGELITVGTKKCLGPCPTLVNACLTQCLKCESGSSRFQPGPGEGPSRGLLSDCTTSPINRFYTALVVTRLHHRMKQCRHTVPSSGDGRGHRCLLPTIFVQVSIVADLRLPVTINCESSPRHDPLWPRPGSGWYLPSTIYCLPEV